MSGALAFLAIASFLVAFGSSDSGRKNAAMVCAAIYLTGACLA